MFLFFAYSQWAALPPTHFKAVGRFPVYTSGQAAGKHRKGTKNSGEETRLKAAASGNLSEFLHSAVFRSARPVALSRAAYN